MKTKLGERIKALEAGADVAASQADVIEGELVAASTIETDFKTGERIFHQKFGYGTITQVDGNKLTIDFEKAGEKRVAADFVERP